MEDQENPSKYTQFLDAMSKIREINELLARGQDDRPEKQKAFKDALGNRVYREMDSEVKPEYRDDLKEETVNEVIRTSLDIAGETSANLISKDLETILGEMPVESFEKMSLDEQIVKRAAGDEKKVFAACGQWQYFEDFKARYQEGKQLSEEQQGMIFGFGAKGLGDKMAKEYKDRGFSEKIQEGMRKIAYQAAKYHYVDLKEYVIPGLEGVAKEHKENYDKIAKNKGSVADMSKRILRRLATGDVNEFNLARKLIYDTSKRSAA